jgi:hypothetical protein
LAIGDSVPMNKDDLIKRAKEFSHRCVKLIIELELKIKNSVPV